MAVPPRRSSSPAPPLDAARLEALALRYVGRYATTRAKLAAYLRRKLDERGWAGDGAAPAAALVERMAALGYVDDRAYAEAKTAALGRRGFGLRRVDLALRAAGIAGEDMAEPREQAEAGALDSALAFARRKRLGPYAPEPLDPERRRKAFAAMLRAGHPADIARRVLSTGPGDTIDPDV